MYIYVQVYTMMLLTVRVTVSASFLVSPSLTVLCVVVCESFLLSMAHRNSLRISWDLEMTSVASCTESLDSGEYTS